MTFNTSQQRDRFIESNLPLVTDRLLERNERKFNDDLFQEGVKALIIATDRFDEERGVKFSTYAVPYIDGAILRYKAYDSIIRPCREHNKWKFHYKEICSFEDCLIKKIPMTWDDYKFEECVLEDIIVNEFLNQLSCRDRFIIESKLEGMSQTKISEIVGVSQQHVSRLINRGGKKYVKCYMA